MSFSSMWIEKINMPTFLINLSLRNPSFTSVGNLVFLISQIGCNLIKLHTPYFIANIPLMFNVFIDSLVKTLINLHKGNIHPIYIYIPFLIIYMCLFRSSSCYTFIILLICMCDLLLLSLLHYLPTKM